MRTWGGGGGESKRRSTSEPFSESGGRVCGQRIPKLRESDTAVLSLGSKAERTHSRFDASVGFGRDKSHSSFVRPNNKL